MRLTRNVCLDYSRATPPLAVLLDETEDSGSNVARTVEAQALGEDVRRAVQQLPEGQRAVFVLSHYEGLTYREVAEALDCPIGTVASRKRTAVEALRQQLCQWNEESKK